mmetsp:Transcript_55110/g.90862  ORF Transcript_55110/g.90862 Transcript_55110/m.90862 type:complete len:81 (+) Transcript_55110:81-323(+)
MPLSRCRLKPNPAAAGAKADKGGHTGLIRMPRAPIQRTKGQNVPAGGQYIGWVAAVQESTEGGGGKFFTHFSAVTVFNAK